MLLTSSKKTDLEQLKQVLQIEENLYLMRNHEYGKSGMQFNR